MEFSSLTLPIHFRLQNSCAPECHHLSAWQLHRLPGLRIPNGTRPFLFHRKFPEPADENIFAILKGLFHQLEEGVNDLGWLSFAEDVFAEKFFDDLGFGESHGSLLENGGEIL